MANLGANTGKVESSLAKVPLIGQVLGLTEEQIKQAMDRIQVEKKAGKNIFICDAIVELKIRTQEEADIGLTSVSIDKAKAAVEDIGKILPNQTLALPAWKKPHWGNGGMDNPVNDPIEDPSKLESTLSASNLAELIVLLANQKPEILSNEDNSKTIKEGVVAAKNLALLISKGHDLLHPLDKADDCIRQATEALKIVAAANGINENIVNKYIAARVTHEVKLGVGGIRSEISPEEKGR
jgi:hypothetical protein